MAGIKPLDALVFAAGWRESGVIGAGTDLRMGVGVGTLVLSLHIPNDLSLLDFGPGANQARGRRSHLHGFGCRLGLLKSCNCCFLSLPLFSHIGGDFQLSHGLGRENLAIVYRSRCSCPVGRLRGDDHGVELSCGRLCGASCGVVFGRFDSGEQRIGVDWDVCDADEREITALGESGRNALVADFVVWGFIKSSDSVR